MWLISNGRISIQTPNTSHVLCNVILLFSRFFPPYQNHIMWIDAYLLSLYLRPCLFLSPRPSLPLEHDGGGGSRFPFPSLSSSLPHSSKGTYSPPPYPPPCPVLGVMTVLTRTRCLLYKFIKVALLSCGRSLCLAVNHSIFCCFS